MAETQVARGGDSLPLDNRRIAECLEMAAHALEAEQDNPFRVRAYRNAAATLRKLDRQAHTIITAEGVEGLTQLPAIGSHLARAIEMLAFTGRLPLLDRLLGENQPEALLATVPGVGPELARRIYEKLGIHSLEDLERAAHDGRLAEVPGMGAKRLAGIRDALAGRLGRRQSQHTRPATSPPAVEDLLELDRQYREQAAAGALLRVTPRRFNPAAEAWLPVMRLRRGGRRYRVLYSNTALAHARGKTRDWVVIYFEDGGGIGQCTVVTATSGTLRGRRVLRGREDECERYYGAARPGGAQAVSP